MTKQLRIDFPDYSAEQQEQDAKARKMYMSQEIYVMRVNGNWGAVWPRKRHNIIFNADKGVELTDFVTNVKADLEELGLKPHFHCVQNFGIECKIAEHQNSNSAKIKAIKEFNERN